MPTFWVVRSEPGQLAFSVWVGVLHKLFSRFAAQLSFEGEELRFEVISAQIGPAYGEDPTTNTQRNPITSLRPSGVRPKRHEDNRRPGS